MLVANISAENSGEAPIQERLAIRLNFENMTVAPPATDDALKADAATAAGTIHSDVTLALAKKESAEHMVGMKELFEMMRHKRLRVKAYAMDDPEAPSPASNANVKVSHFVRHGQGFHNLMADMVTSHGRTWKQFEKSPNNPYTMPELLDSPLTDKGRKQAYLLQPRVQSIMQSKGNEHKAQPIQLVISSPNCRALQTAAIVFEQLVPDESIPFLSHEMVREETGVHICDKRRPTARQQAEFPRFDFSLLLTDAQTDGDPIYNEHARETKQQVGERIYQFMEWLHKRPEQHIAVASHSGWLLTLFNGICECNDTHTASLSLQDWFQTGEMRSVVLEFLEQ